MYRFPSDLNLDLIIGNTLDFIGLGLYSLQLGFSTAGVHMTIQGSVVITENGKTIASWAEKDMWSSLSFQKILNAKVNGYFVINERLLEIKLDKNLAIRLYDNSDAFETIQISFSDKDKSLIVI